MDKYREKALRFKEAIKGTEFVVFDTETTGLSSVNDSVIEFAAIKCMYDGTNYVEKDSIDILINPGIVIPEKITEITGISNEMVKDAPGSKEAARIIRDFFGDGPLVMGYNSVSFDTGFVNGLYHMIGEEFDPRLHLDVLVMAKEKTPKPHKLINLAERAGVADKYRFHRSLDDVRATFDVYRYLIPMYEEKEAEQDDDFSILRIQRWQKHALDRIYVNNNLNLSIFLDVPTKNWSIQGNLDEKATVAKILAHAGVNTEDELINLLCST